MKTARRSATVALVFTIACAVIGFALGQSYIPRLPDHRGRFLVAVEDHVRAPLAKRPRHTVFILVDGLRRDFAESMSVTRELLRAGQCRVSDQGSWTVSRPVYALLSTGLEVDRTGARNNEQTAPLAAQSIWEVARAQGLRVSGSSHLPWFKELFPEGFDRYATANSHADDVFEGPELLDLNVFHPLYVDEAGHQHGAASPVYAERVARADREIARVLAKLDLTQDLVVFTADHGHRAEGGHGGAQPEIKDVLLCFAGPHVAKRADRARFDGRTTAPTLALLLGLPFPRHMRAGDDGLDAMWEVASFGEEDRAYEEDRRAAVVRFRAENSLALAQWLGGPPGTWPRLYDREAGRQDTRVAVAAVLVVLVVWRLAGGRRRGPPIVLTFGWLALTLLATWAVHRMILGELDFTVINLKRTFLPRAFAIVLVSSAVAVGAHAALVRSVDALVRDLLALLGLLLAVNLGHVFAYGWPLGFPLPPPAARYFPFFGAIALLGHALVTLLVLRIAKRRASSTSRGRSLDT